MLVRYVTVLVLTALCGIVAGAARSAESRVDVAIYGGTPAGIAAALAAGKSGSSVLLIEPYRHIGGLVSNGLSHPDFRTFEGLNGTFLDYTHRVKAYYTEKYGEDSPQVRDYFRGTHAEPHVTRLIVERMLDEQPSVAVKQQFRLGHVQMAQAEDSQRIERAVFVGPRDEPLTVAAKIFIDATYEGDLMAMAGVAYRVGREARVEYNESLAPEVADRQVQGYNFRLIMTRDPANRVMPAAPAGYRREEFLDLVPLLEAGRFETVFCYPTGGIYKAHLPPLPNRKHDINDVSHGLVRLSLPDISDDWPDGDAATRRRIFDEHVRHNMGMLYFLQNDDAVPQRYRDDARQWGWCRDEFVDNGHVPEQLYVREARRMVGQHVFTEGDTDHAEDDARAVLHTDAIAMGDYGPNCHGTAHEGPRFGGRHTGEFYKGVSPYQIPYGVLVPRDCENLLVPVACSASHVGFCALRLEPIWMSLGQAAGFAAHLAGHEGAPVQQVEVPSLQRLLHADESATIYVSDVPPGADDFAAVQWWGTHGGLHGLAPRPAKPGQRGPHLTGQYYHAFPNHAAELDQPIDDELRERWLKLAAALDLPTETLGKERTRGGWIRSAFALYNDLE